MNFLQKLTIFIYLFSISVYSTGKEDINSIKQDIVFDYNSLKINDLQEGLAGTFAGKYKNYYIVAGGSYFSKGKPWEGGKKQFSKKIIVFEMKNGAFSPIYQGDDLPEPLAEGGFVSTENGLFCIGGQTENGLSKKVFSIAFENGKIALKNYADLPFAVKSCAVAQLKGEVYVLGGQEVSGNSSDQFLKLTANGWENLPSYPKKVSAAAMVGQQSGNGISLFAFGGRNLENNKLTSFYSEVYQFQLTENQWISKKNISYSDKNLPLAAFSAVPMGASTILLFSGDTGEIYNRVEKAINADNQALRNELWQQHSGFFNEILAYNTITNAWFSLGKINNPTAVNTAFYDDATQQIFIVGGEQKPGIRSPFITKFYIEKTIQFGWLNYAVLIIYFIGMLFLGFFFMKKDSNTDDYFKASGRIPWWAAGISIFATMLSAITFISIPAKAYATDWRMLLFNMTIILAVPVVIRYFLPYFIRFNYETAYEYLEERFNRSVRYVASALFSFFMISRIAIVLFLPSLALNIVTGFNIYYAILIMSLVTIIYSASGGMEAVVWGDVIQGFILVGGAVAAVVFMILGVKGGVSEFISISLEHNKLAMFDFEFDFSKPVFWVVILGGFANTIISYTSDQSVVQRYMTTSDEKATAKSIWLNGIISIPVSILFFLLGAGLFAFYKSNPELFSVTDKNIDAVFPQFIVSQLPMGFAGLLIASIFAAAMSTLSSNINSVSAAITSDFYKTMVKNSSFKSQMAVARWSGVIVGLLGTAMALILAKWDIASLWDQFNTFLGLLTSGLGALFLLGIFFKRVNGTAALIGLFAGVVLLYIIKVNTNISFLLYGFLGMIFSIAVALLVSIFYPAKNNFHTDNKLK